MNLKQDSSCDNHSDTESNLSSEFDQLNTARIEDYLSCSFYTPNKTQSKLKKKEVVEDSSDEEDWRTDYTKTIYNGSPLTKTVQNQQKITKKYPREKKNIKNRTVTVKTKSQAVQKYENVCSICLDNYSDTRSLLKCGHKFCNECIDEWIKSSTNCPNCRATFEEYVKITVDSKNKIQEKREIVKVQPKRMEYNELDYYICYECGQGDDEDVLLICDMCDFYCCHVYCDPELNDVFPTEDWFCKNCHQVMKNSQQENERSAPIIRTQSLRNQSRQLTQISKTFSLAEQSQTFESDDESSEQEEIQNNFLSIRKTRAATKKATQAQTTTRSKAYQIMNFDRNPRSRAPEIIQRIENLTVNNLRNLRRRRYH